MAKPRIVIYLNDTGDIIDIESDQEVEVLIDDASCEPHDVCQVTPLWNHVKVAVAFRLHREREDRKTKPPTSLFEG